MKRRDANIILVALVGAGGGVTAWTLPLSLFERGVEATGLPSLIPSMAPPLGPTAQMLIIAASVVLCALVAALILPWGRAGRPRGEKGGIIMSFLFSRLAGFTRGRNERARPASLEHYPVLDAFDPAPTVRRSDAHPDAPARAPLFVRRDLGEDMLPVDADSDGWADPEPEEIVFPPDERAVAPLVRDITGLSMPRAPEPMPWDMIEKEMSRILQGVRCRAPDDQWEEGEDEDASSGAAAGPGLAELAERLERGLARRRARLSGVTVEDWSPEEGSGSAIDDRMDPPVDELADEGRPDPRDEDLERALAALRSITARTG